MNVDKFTIVSYDQFTGFDAATGNLEMIMDELTDFTLSNSEEKTELKGKNGRTIGSLKKNKKVIGKGTNGMLSGGALATMLGSDIVDGLHIVSFTDTVTVSKNKATTTQVAVGTIGNEIGTIYIRNAENAFVSGGRKLTQVADVPASGEFIYNPSTKVIEFYADDVADGTEIIMFYDTEVTGKKITNDTDTYSKVLRGILDVTCKDGCDNLFHGQFLFGRADFSGTFDLGGSEAATLGFEFESLPNLCTGKTDLWDFVLF